MNSAPQATRRATMSARARRGLTPWGFIGPALVLLVVFRVVPAFVALRESMFQFSFVEQRKRFVGLDNFRELLGSDEFRQSMRVTIVFNAVVNPLQCALALLMALLMNQRLRFIGWFRTAYMVPIAMSLNVSAIIWLLMLDPNGLLNGLIGAVGLAEQPFLQSDGQALWSIAAMASWVGVPLWSLFLLAALQGIPRELREASRVDGASEWQHFRRIVLPALRPAIAFVLVADTIANFLLFVPVHILTQGGPSGSTNLLMYDAYKRGLVFGDLGGSSAVVVIVLVMALVFVSIETRLTRRP